MGPFKGFFEPFGTWRCHPEQPEAVFLYQSVPFVHTAYEALKQRNCFKNHSASYETSTSVETDDAVWRTTKRRNFSLPYWH